MKKLILIALIALGVTAQSQTTVPLKVTVTGGTVVTTPTGTQAVSMSGGSLTVVGFTAKSSTTLATTTGSYAAEENVGGINTVTLALRTTTSTAQLNTIDIWDLSNQKSTLEIHLWDASPSGTFTDNAAEVIAGDQAKFLGHIIVGGADYTTTGAVAVATINNIGKLIKANASTSIYATVKIISNGSTYASNAIIINWYFSQD